MLSLLVAGLLVDTANHTSGPASLFQVGPGFESWGRPSQAIRKAQAPIVAANTRTANVARQTRRSQVVGKNRERMRTITEPRPPIGSTIRVAASKPKMLPTTFVYKPRFVGKVRTSVTDELGRPVPDLTLRVNKTQRSATTVTLWAMVLNSEDVPFMGGSEGWQGRKANASGMVVLSPEPEPLPAAYSVELAAGSHEYSLDGNEGEGQVVTAFAPQEAVVISRGWRPNKMPPSSNVAPTAPSVNPLIASLQSRGIEAQLGRVVQSPEPGKPMKLAPDKKSYLVEVNYTLQFEVQAAEKVEVRREVADFRLPKDVGLPALAMKTPRLYLGEELLSLRDAGEHWAFRAKRDNLGNRDAKFILEYELNGLGFGGEVSAGRLSPQSFYNTNGNQLPKAIVSLESVAEGSVVLAGRQVDDAFPLSPLYWLASGNASSARMALNLGSSLQAMLKSTTPMRPEIAGPGKEKLRYGMWYTAPGAGLAIRTRCDNPKLGDQVLPGEGEGGLIEAIRVIGGDASTNNIAGVLHIGADRDAIVAAFGPPDTIPTEAHEALFGKDDKARAVLGDPKKFEYWDETFLYGGVRVKWKGTKVKWYEVARPVALLYNGTRAFVPPQPISVAFNIQTSRTSDDSLAEPVKRVLETAFDRASGVNSSSSSADWQVSADVQATASRRPAERKIRVRVGKNSKGKDVYEDRTERYTELTVRVAVKFTARDREGKEKTANWTKADSRDEASSSSSDILDWIVSNRRGVTDISDTLEKEAARFVTGLSNVTGTVLAVNAQDGTMLINLGKRHGVQTGGAMDFELFLAHRVNPRTGIADPGAKVKLIGEDVGKAWVEAIKVGDDWSIAQVKMRSGIMGDVGSRTRTAYEVIPRLIDPGSGVLRVRIAPRRKDR